MSEQRYAVLIGNSSFPSEAKLPPLRFPENDVDALHELITSEEHGIFTQTFVLKNRSSQEVRERANEVLNLAERDDLVLLYYAGHGKLNRRGKLHLATVDTRLSTLEATSFPVSSLRDFMEISRSKRIVVILDCCYSGAAGGVFTRGTTDDSLQQFASGRGIQVMTASTGIEVAEEREQDGHGVFTKHLLAGIRGGADEDGDGLVSVDELYRYVHRHVVQDSAQVPTMLNLEKAGDLIIAKSGRKPREERNRQIAERLFRLAQEGVVTHRFIGDVLASLETRYAVRTARQKEQHDLLERWMGEKLGIGELVECWNRLGLEEGAIVVPARPAPVDEAPAPIAPAPPEPVPPAPAPVVVDRRDEPRRAPWTLRSILAALRAAPARALASGLDGRLGLSLLLAAVFTFNLVETNLETLAAGSAAGQRLAELGNDFALASQKLEGDLGLAKSLNFVDHDAAPRLSAVVYSASYFFVFPALCVAVALGLARRREIAPFRVYTLALAADYAVSLPFFLLLPIPERWAFPGSGAILLSDSLSSHLIDAIRPMSGLDNCFPSFHVSMTVIAILVCFRFKARFRVAALGLGATVVLSTLVLGIHWVGDMIAGTAVAAFSVAVAAWLDVRLAARRPRPAAEPAPEPSSISAVHRLVHLRP